MTKTDNRKSEQAEENRRQGGRNPEAADGSASQEQRAEASDRMDSQEQRAEAVDGMNSQEQRAEAADESASQEQHLTRRLLRAQKKAARRRERQELWAAIDLEMRQNRTTFIVFSVLRVLVILCLVRQLMLGNYEGFFLCILTLILFGVPSYLQVKLKVEIPQTLEIIVLLFIFAAEILGEISSFYTIFPFWDTILHTLNGFLAAAVGFSLVLILNRNEKIMFSLSPLYLAIVAFCFSMTIGVIWEFVEFTFDMLFGLDMQKDTVVHTISSILLNPDGLQRPVAIRHITDTVVNGQELGINGYLDIGLLDTMEDLIVNFIGALVFSVIGYFALRGGKKERHITQQLMAYPKKPESDFLQRLRAGDESLRSRRKEKAGKGERTQKKGTE